MCRLTTLFSRSYGPELDWGMILASVEVYCILERPKGRGCGFTFGVEEREGLPVVVVVHIR